VGLGSVEETGVVAVDKLVTVADAGLAINPEGVEGQDLGAATQGLGAALSDELLYDGEQLRNSNMVEYRVPHIGSSPRVFDSYIARAARRLRPVRARRVSARARASRSGVRRLPRSPVRSAVWSGRTVCRLTPERVWRLAERARAPRESRSET
jgi:Molybdopterin-binding domain of aldehyde dehydrogenase